MNASVGLLEVVAQSTPNPLAHRFVTSVELLAEGAAEFARGESHAPSALLEGLFALAGVERVYVSGYFVTVLKGEGADWAELAPQVRQRLREVLSAGLSEGGAWVKAAEPATETPAAEHEPALQEWFRRRILPATESDGGAIFFEGVVGGELRLRARGACQSCPYLPMTVQRGILGPLREQRPELAAARVSLPQGEVRFEPE